MLLFNGSPLLFSRNDGGGFEELNLMRFTVGAEFADGATRLVASPSSSSAVCLARFFVGAARAFWPVGAFAFFFEPAAAGGEGEPSSFADGVLFPSLIVSFFGAEGAAAGGAGSGGGGGAGELRGDGVEEPLPNFSLSFGR